MKSIGSHALLGFLVLFSIAGVILGLRGMAILEIANDPPFRDSDTAVFDSPFPPAPRFVILAWHSTAGRAITWLLCLGGITYSSLSFARKKHYPRALLLLSCTTLLSGGVGLWIYLYATINVV